MNEKRLLETFLELVQIDSESGHEKAVANYLVTRFDSLSMDWQIDKAGEQIDSDVGNLFARMKGTVPGSICLSAHMDTVKPGIGVKPQTKSGFITSDGTTILGADDKSGLAVMLEVLEYFKDRPHPTIELVCDIQEEMGLRGASLFDASVLESKETIVLDTNGAPGAIIMAAPYQVVYNTIINGKSSHAGIAPEKGISAIRVASEAIANMKLGRIDKETTSNIGVIKGGKSFNIVPDYCEVLFEARSIDKTKFDTQVSHMKDEFLRACGKVGATVEFVPENLLVGFRFTPEDELPSKLAKAATDVGIEPRFDISGGGSVANVFNAKGKTAVVVSTGMENPHGLDERIKIEHLNQLGKWMIRLVEIVGGVA
ncbi:MAG TPA: M20/M25/M40 family metallo-hydrolase [Caldisericia bacterium]|nr:M20/M25/M40 family metallo-hydrolase [Caldisericia bacterium]HPF49374.1 M20/M25/M40 family metallo-hydrolase [Caldisericia bacterium]HPI84450.1 M20/M25/M40 family metallo-hydrolase [Caldisericia bacterium]HPQ93789.1 M20/M25/M40 family metallo-hydrolase [Caldisericia bacterium]HRV75647.1 M20/M25/M40 family metallo-hydrolase [Caldisericia bacterium]